MTELFIDGPAGRLQLRFEPPPGSPRAVAVICHPHPLHGGTLDNKVVHQLAKTFVGLGAVAVRFNFRGVGGSEGEYDEGRGELDDLLTVVEWAAGRWPGLPLWLAGFSFGAYLALRAAERLAPRWLVTVAPAIGLFDASPVRLNPATSWLLIQGDADDIVPAPQVEAWVASMESKPRLVLLAGAGHFFHGRLNELRQVVSEDLASL